MRLPNITGRVRDGRKALGVAGGVFVLLFIVGYSLFAAYPYLSGPSLSLSHSQNSGLTTLFGETERVSYLSINGAAVPVGEDGSFEVTRAYPKGYTAVTAVGRDRFGRTITKTLSFVTPVGTTTPYGTEEEN